MKKNFNIVKLGVLIVILIAISIEFKNSIDKLEWARNNAKLTKLNNLIPTYESLYVYVREDVRADPESLNKYISYFEQVLDTYPNLAEGYSILGYLYNQIDEQEKSLIAFSKSLKLNPNFIFALYNHGLMQYELENYDLAYQSFSRASSMRIEDQLKIIVTSKIYTQLIQSSRLTLESLAKSMEEIVIKNQEMLVISAFYIKKYEDMLNGSISLQKRSLDKSAKYNYLAGLAAFELEDFEKSVFFLKKSIEAEPNYRDAYRLLAVALKNLGGNDLALEMLQKALIINTLLENNRVKEPMSYLESPQYSLEIF